MITHVHRTIYNAASDWHCIRSKGVAVVKCDVPHTTALQVCYNFHGVLQLIGIGRCFILGGPISYWHSQPNRDARIFLLLLAMLCEAQSACKAC